MQPENTISLPPLAINQLPELVAYAVQAMGWTKLTPVQSVSLPYMLRQMDVMVQAKTGSGKTAAFMLPILNRIDPLEDACQALILVPTRELAMQVKDEGERLSQGAGVRVVPVYGGVKYGGQLRDLEAGAHIVVGTPGRVLDHLMRGSLKLDLLHTFVLDEADRMLSMGFYPDMKQVKRYLPQRKIHSCMFSATFPVHVMRLAQEFLRQPQFVNLSQDSVHVTGLVDHVVYSVPNMEKDRYLVKIIEQENPPAAIIFCNTKQRVNYVTIVLQRYGYDADQLSSDLAQNQREAVLNRVKEGTLRFLVATDVAARGIDIPELSHVIQYEPPDDVEQYIHRAGRTGRAGASGTAITLVEGAEEIRLYKIGKQYKIDFIQRPLPTDAEVARVLEERIGTHLKIKRRGRDKLQAERMMRFLPFVQQLAQDEDGQELLAMLVDDYYQETIHTPPPLPTHEPQHHRKDSDEYGKRDDKRKKKKRYK